MSEDGTVAGNDIGSTFSLIRVGKLGLFPSVKGASVNVKLYTTPLDRAIIQCTIYQHHTTHFHSLSTSEYTNVTTDLHITPFLLLHQSVSPRYFTRNHSTLVKLTSTSNQQPHILKVKKGIIITIYITKSDNIKYHIDDIHHKDRQYPAVAQKYYNTDDNIAITFTRR